MDLSKENRNYAKYNIHFGHQMTKRKKEKKDCSKS